MFGEFKVQCERVIKDAVSSRFPQQREIPFSLQPPPEPEIGELSTAISFDLSKIRKQPPVEVAGALAQSIRLEPGGLIERVEQVGPYLNFRFNYEKGTKQVLQATVENPGTYGYAKVETPVRIVVEHTSANPSGPLHLGTARNAMLGDAVARLLKARGHLVSTHFYIDDVGRQVAILAYGYKILGKPKPVGKVDTWAGGVYAATNCALEVQALKEQLAQTELEAEKRNQIQTELSQWVGIAEEIQAKLPELAPKLFEETQARRSANKEVDQLISGYEQGDPEPRKLIREVVDICLVGIRETLHTFGIEFDQWDWESDLVWSQEVATIVKKIEGLPWIRTEGRAVIVEVNRLIDDMQLRNSLGIPENYEVPPLTLVKSDGSTLYPTRDIAYSLRKSANADRVVNVIGIDQKTTQLQIRAVLFALGFRQQALSVQQYAYEIVDLPGERMSKRRGQFISLDETISQARARVRSEVEGRQELTGEDKQAIVDTIALGAIRYAMLSVSAQKRITFTWDRVLSLEKNSAPFVNYAYTRAAGILRRVAESGVPDFSGLNHSLEKQLIMLVGQLPEVIANAADSMKPEDVAFYANTLAERFHEYYEKVQVLRAETPGLGHARVELVKAVQIALRNAMNLLGIGLIKKM